MVLEGQGIYSDCKIYVVTNYNQNFRKTACIYRNGSHVKSVGYAKYLMETHLGHSIPDGFEVDHIDGLCTDDRIENLQVISKELNVLKEIYDDCKFKIYVRLICPNCGSVFNVENHDFATKIKLNKYICCSRICSGKMTMTSKYSDLSGSPFRPRYEYIIGYFYDLNYILEIEKTLEANNVKYVKKYR